jgi:hypothetical protein
MKFYLLVIAALYVVLLSLSVVLVWRLLVYLEFNATEPRKDLEFMGDMRYPGFMNGLAERQDGLARKLVSILKIGNAYTLEEMAGFLGHDKNAVTRKGVLTKAESDAQILLITLKKDKYSTPEYWDTLHGTRLIWSGQNSQKATEKKLVAGTHDTFIFLQERRKTPYIYYGRAIPIRKQINWEPGKPSHIVFELIEYAASLERKSLLSSREHQADEVVQTEQSYVVSSQPERTEAEKLATIRTAQTTYRKNVLAFWNEQCAVTGVDNKGWLIASHIKPWRESSDEERMDPHNSLLLTPNFDKLFDRGVISFSSSNGKIILPEHQSRTMWNNLSRMHIDDSITLRDVPDGVGEFLDYHSRYVYNFEPNDDISTEEFIQDILVKGLV